MVAAKTGGPVQVMVGGRGLACDFKGDVAVLRLPAVAIGVPLASLRQRLARVPWWVQIDGITEVLTADAATDHERRPVMEEGLLTTWQALFAWLLLSSGVSGWEVDLGSSSPSLPVWTVSWLRRRSGRSP